MSLDPQSVASLLTALGVIIAVFVGYKSTVRTLTVEIRKKRYGVLSVYAEKLSERRLAAYLELYPLLSDTVKMIDYPDLFPEATDIEAIERQLNHWDSKYGLLLTKKSGARAMKARATLRSVSRRGYRTIQDCIRDPGIGKELADAFIGLEVELRVDLGIYALADWNIETGFGSYAGREPTPDTQVLSPGSDRETPGDLDEPRESEVSRSRTEPLTHPRSE